MIDKTILNKNTLINLNLYKFPKKIVNIKKNGKRGSFINIEFEAQLVQGIFKKTQSRSTTNTSMIRKKTK
jgi:hypothetical protein